MPDWRVCEGAMRDGMRVHAINEGRSSAIRLSFAAIEIAEAEARDEKFSAAWRKTAILP
jgi:hypothetical protein